jgi:hypothetical protein
VKQLCCCRKAFDFYHAPQCQCYSYLQWHHSFGQVPRLASIIIFNNSLHWWSNTVTHLDGRPSPALHLSDKSRLIHTQ